MNKNAKVPSPELLQEATRYGYTGFFVHKDTVQEAYDYALDIVKELGTDGARMMLGLQVLLNTLAIGTAKHIRVIKQLEELARATKCYCEDASRSERRRLAMIEGADEAIEAAKDYIE